MKLNVATILTISRIVFIPLIVFFFILMMENTEISLLIFFC